MNLEHIHKRLAELRSMAGDDEMAHGAEDELRADFIAHVAASGPADLAEMAREVLTSSAIEFCRWCA